MPNTNTYEFTVYFEVGSAELLDRASIRSEARPPDWMGAESLRQAVWRARAIPDHRLLIETHDDPSDARDVGAASVRMQAMRNAYSQAGIPLARIESVTHASGCCTDCPGEFARRAELILYPRIASLSDSGAPFLDLDEIRALRGMRDAVLFQPDLLEARLEQHADYDWYRIVGHESVAAWALAGATHTYYVED